jgi:formiminotetrahydrofolate cyclodeaminase
VDDLFRSPVGELLARVATDDPEPGSGALAGITLAFAAAVVTGAARASLSAWDEARAVAAQGEALRARAERLAAEDAVAYRAARKALGQGSGPGLAAALDYAAVVPMQLASAASDVAQLALEVTRRGDPERRDDVAAAAHLAAGAAAAAARLVAANLTAAPGDERVVHASRLAQDAAEAAGAAAADA